MPIPFPFPWRPLGSLADIITFIVLILINFCRPMAPQFPDQQ
jgi:hypothetical protein